MDKKKGVSLIVLIITIIVVIILASVIILTVSKNNPIESAKEASFKEDVRVFQDELSMAISKQYIDSAGQRDYKITTLDYNEIKNYIPSFSKKYQNKFKIEDDILKYTKVSAKEKVWCESMNVAKGLFYTELEYLESDGNQWINTNFNSTEAKIIITCLFNSPNNRSQVLVNCNRNTGGWFGLNSSGKIVVDRSVMPVPYNEKNTYTLEYENYNIRCTDSNGNIVNFSFYANTDFTIFSSGNYSYTSLAKVFDVKIYNKDGNLVRDYIPVLDTKGVPCFYDKVDEKYYYNKGRGEFTYALKE